MKGGSHGGIIKKKNTQQKWQRFRNGVEWEGGVGGVGGGCKEQLAGHRESLW